MNQKGFVVCGFEKIVRVALKIKKDNPQTDCPFQFLYSSYSSHQEI